MDYTIIKKLLEERNISFKDLSDKLGVDRNNLYNSLTKGNPTLQRLESIAEAIGVPVWRLFTEYTKPEVYGSITYKDTVYCISSKEELKAITTKVMGTDL